MLRRRFLVGTGAALASGVGSFGNLAMAAETAKLAMPSDACRPTPRQTLGPYLTPDSPNRSDIREDRPGVPLHLTLNIVDDFRCRPIEGAVIDVWHADAEGLYSGVDNEQFDLTSLELSGASIDQRGRTFLRGHQKTGTDGRVEFTTILPGWYTGRLGHIHLRTIIQGIEWTSHATQLYFPQEVERAVYATGPYKQRGQNPIGIDRDLVVRGDAAAVKQLTVPLERDGEGFRGKFDVAVSF